MRRGLGEVWREGWRVWLGGRGIIGGIMVIIIMVIEWVLRCVVGGGGREVMMGCEVLDRLSSPYSIGERVSG